MEATPATLDIVPVTRRSLLGPELPRDALALAIPSSPGSQQANSPNSPEDLLFLVRTLKAQQYLSHMVQPSVASVLSALLHLSLSSALASERKYLLLAAPPSAARRGGDEPSTSQQLSSPRGLVPLPPPPPSPSSPAPLVLPSAKPVVEVLELPPTPKAGRSTSAPDACSCAAQLLHAVEASLGPQAAHAAAAASTPELPAPTAAPAVSAASPAAAAATAAVAAAATAAATAAGAPAADPATTQNGQQQQHQHQHQQQEGERYSPDCIRMGVSTDIGQRSSMQDFAFAMPLTRPDSAGCWFRRGACFGVFDGHGGHEVAQILAENVPDQILTSLHHIVKDGPQQMGEILLNQERRLRSDTNLRALFDQPSSSSASHSSFSRVGGVPHSRSTVFSTTAAGSTVHVTAGGTTMRRNPYSAGSALGSAGSGGWQASGGSGGWQPHPKLHGAASGGILDSGHLAHWPGQGCPGLLGTERATSWHLLSSDSQGAAEIADALRGPSRLSTAVSVGAETSSPAPALQPQGTAVPDAQGPGTPASALAPEPAVSPVPATPASEGAEGRSVSWHLTQHVSGGAGGSDSPKLSTSRPPLPPHGPPPRHSRPQPSHFHASDQSATPSGTPASPDVGPQLRLGHQHSNSSPQISPQVSVTLVETAADGSTPPGHAAPRPSAFMSGMEAAAAAIGSGGSAGSFATPTRHALAGNGHVPGLQATQLTSISQPHAATTLLELQQQPQQRVLQQEQELQQLQQRQVLRIPASQVVIELLPSGSLSAVGVAGAPVLPDNILLPPDLPSPQGSPAGLPSPQGQGSAQGAAGLLPLLQEPLAGLPQPLQGLGEAGLAEPLDGGTTPTQQPGRHARGPAPPPPGSGLGAGLVSECLQPATRAGVQEQVAANGGSSGIHQRSPPAADFDAMQQGARAAAAAGVAAGLGVDGAGLNGAIMNGAAVKDSAAMHGEGGPATGVPNGAGIGGAGAGGVDQERAEGASPGLTVDLDGRDPGSTALVATIFDCMMYVANVGDCRLILAELDEESGRVKPRAVTVDHCPDRHEGERERLAALQVPVSEEGYVGPDGGYLQVSRSIGDFSIKTQLGDHVILSEPELHTVQLRPSTLFAVAASDGITCVMKDEVIVDQVCQFLNTKPLGGVANDPQYAAEQLVRYALDVRNSDDNASVVVACFKDVKPPLPPRPRLFRGRRDSAPAIAVP